jgi:tetratricopeptide (TPR) repeat protein
MTSSQPLYAAQHRLAQHYMNRLQQASLNVQKGQANKAYWFDQVEQDWAQIQHWQAWSTDVAPQDETAARLCIEFPLMGADILAIRQNPVDRLNWLETALRLSETTSPSKTCIILRFLYQTCFHLNALDKAEPYIHQLIQLGRVSDDPVHLGYGIYALGHITEERGNYDQAEDYYCQSLEIFIANGADIEQVQVLNGLGSISSHRGQYQRSYDYFFRSLCLAERFGQENKICMTLFGLAEILVNLRDFEASEKYAQRGVDLCRAIQHRRVLSACLSTLGYCAFEKGHYESALRYYEESLELGKRGAFQRSVLRTLYRSGHLYFHIGMYDRALETFEQGLGLARQAKQLHFLCNILRDMANTHLALGNIAAAQQDLREALLASQRLNSDPQKSRTILSGIMLWQQMGDPEQAAQWAGALFGCAYIDEKIFKPLCAQLEAELGTQDFNMALEQGKSLPMDEIIAYILAGLLSENRVAMITNRPF